MPRRKNNSKSGKDKMYKVERIIDKKIVKGKPHYLVKWKRYGAPWNSWEPEENFLNRYPIECYENSLLQHNQEDGNSQEAQAMAQADDNEEEVAIENGLVEQEDGESASSIVADMVVDDKVDSDLSELFQQAMEQPDDEVEIAIAKLFEQVSDASPLPIQDPDNQQDTEEAASSAVAENPIAGDEVDSDSFDIFEQADDEVEIGIAELNEHAYEAPQVLAQAPTTPRPMVQITKAYVGIDQTPQKLLDTILGSIANKNLNGINGFELEFWVDDELHVRDYAFLEAKIMFPTIVADYLRDHPELAAIESRNPHGNPNSCNMN